MPLSWRKSKDIPRDLRTVCPDGVVIETPWDDNWTWCDSAQFAQAEMHRQEVRYHLSMVRILERAA